MSLNFYAKFLILFPQAYRNFGNRIKNLQKKLEEQKKILPSPASPVPSPPTDAPSPVDSLNGDCNRDNMEMVDMDLSDEEVAAGTSTSGTIWSCGSEIILWSLICLVILKPCVHHYYFHNLKFLSLPHYYFRYTCHTSSIICNIWSSAPDPYKSWHQFFVLCCQQFYKSSASI